MSIYFSDINNGGKKMYDIIADKYIIIFNKRFDINETLIGPQIVVEFN